MSDAMTEPVAPDDDDGLTMAELAQLLTQKEFGRLEFNSHIPPAAAAIELVLLGRIGTVPHQPDYGDLRLVAHDPEPTGNTILDAQLRFLVTHGDAMAPHKLLRDTRIEVTTLMHAALERRGIVRTHGTFPTRWGYLDIIDFDGFDRERRAAAEACDDPYAVTDPRLAGVVDVLRNSGAAWKIDQNTLPHILREWYPADRRSAVRAVLIGERIRAAHR